MNFHIMRPLARQVPLRLTSAETSRLFSTTLIKLQKQPFQNDPNLNNSSTKKKYNFAAHQNLDLDSKPQNPLEGQQFLSAGEQARQRQTYETAQRFQAVIYGLLSLGGMIVGFEIYNNWGFLRSKVLGGRKYDLSHFDESYDQLKLKQAKKQKQLEKQSYTLTNPNGPAVPGLYICGSNTTGLIDDKTKTSKSKDDESPKQHKLEFQPILKRLDQFDNVLARDVCLGTNSATLIDEKGNLFQWGDGFLGDSTKPTIKGQNLIKAQISNGTVYALTSKGQVIYFPENSQEQEKFTSSYKSWLLGITKENPFKKLNLKDVADIATGDDHIVLLNSQGHVFISATGLTPIQQSYGQFGLPNYSQFDKPPKPNQIHEVTLLNKFRQGDSIINRKITKIAAGDKFTLCLDSLGSIWAFGKNTYGTVGKEVNYNTEIIPYPSKIELISKHFSRTQLPQCIDIAAGGETAFATFVSSDIYHLFEKSLKEKASHSSNSLNIEELTNAENSNMLHFAWGHGLKGELGVGHFVHGQAEPNKIKTLNNIKEFNEETQKIENIPIKNWSVGKNHIAVTLKNDDVFVWGDNEFGQLGNGKRIRLATPTTLPSILEPENENKKVKFKKVNDRMSLLENDDWEQVIVTGNYNSAIFYRRK